ncbi:MAG: ferredoxin [Acidobacteria bacterium]|nr:ferredoxin [Acidobacteriota bacterium]MCB9398022.1 ferredoxin [Acidobacteriota bacterium]
MSSRSTPLASAHPTLKWPLGQSENPGIQDHFCFFAGLAPDTYRTQAWSPAVVLSPAFREQKRLGFPVLIADQGPVTSFFPVLDSALEKFPLLFEHRAFIYYLTRQALITALEMSAEDLLSSLSQKYMEGADLSQAGRSQVQQAWSQLQSNLPFRGRVLGLSEKSLRVFYQLAHQAMRSEEWQQFFGRLNSLKTDLEARLRTHHMQSQPSDQAESQLGQLANQFIQLGAVNQKVGGKRMGSIPLDEHRVQRMRTAYDSIVNFLKRYSANEVPLIWVEANREPCAEAESLLTCAMSVHADTAEQITQCFKAMRIADLELRNHYHAELHDNLFERFDRHALSPNERRLLPVTVIYASDPEISKDPALGDLLMSGAPIHLIMEQAVFPVGEYTSDQAYRAMAYREAFILEGSLADPAHLYQGLLGMQVQANPAFAVVAVPQWQSEEDPSFQVAAAVTARETVLFRYNPTNGPTFATNLDVEGNPHALKIHCPFTLPVTEPSLVCAFTFADFAAFDPELEHHFWPIPRDQWGDHQMVLDAYFEQLELGQPDKVPYIWGVDSQGELTRVLISRKMMLAARRRRHFWLSLQELSGLANAFAQKAAELARAEAESEAQQTLENLLADHKRELAQATEQASRNAYRRLAYSLVHMPEPALVSSSPALSPALAPSAPSEPKPPAPQTQATAQPAAAKPAETAPVVPSGNEEPYIDSDLCTSCNECINLNGMMFAYNGDKQATIADASAGTFAQLVQAANKCPARCIHPGTPRPDDATATPDVVAQAEPFR